MIKYLGTELLDTPVPDIYETAIPGAPLILLGAEWLQPTPKSGDEVLASALVQCQLPQ